jgi:hypothetical protein
VLGARARADGSVEVYLNGALILEADVGPEAGAESFGPHQEPGFIGIGVTGGTGVARFDDFGGS